MEEIVITGMGIISAGGQHLTRGDFLANVGIDASIPIAVGGLENTEEFHHVHVTQRKPDIEPQRSKIGEIAKSHSH